MSVPTLDVDTTPTESPATTQASTPGNSSGHGDVEPPRRLVVELNRVSAQKLLQLTEAEELNKTTLVNRAIQVYALLREVENAGGAIFVRDSSTEPLGRLRIM
jgi:hypothetical protein